MAGADVSDERSSAICIEENVEREGIWGASGGNADRVSSIIEERLRMSL
jgi:hypothetical protein